MKIHHIGYLTKNLTATQKEFQKLGFMVEQGAAFDSYRGIRIEFLRNDAYCVELIEPQGKESPLYPLLKKYKNTPYHFCYETEDLRKELLYMEQNGYRIIQEPLPAPCMGG